MTHPPHLAGGECRARCRACEVAGIPIPLSAHVAPSRPESLQVAPCPPEVVLNPRPSRLVLPLALVMLVAASAARATAPPQPVGRTTVRPPAAKAATADTGARKALVVEGDDHLFMVSAPKGWVLDDTSGMGSRIRCVFYPKGQKWATAPTVMYVNPLHGYTAKNRTVSSLISDDARSFLKRSPRGKVADMGKLSTMGGKSASIRYFSVDDGPPHEAVAYVPENDLVMLIVLSSKTPQGFQQALPAYRELIGTYAWVGTNREFGR